MFVYRVLFTRRSSNKIFPFLRYILNFKRNLFIDLQSRYFSSNELEVLVRSKHYACVAVNWLKVIALIVTEMIRKLKMFSAISREISMGLALFERVERSLRSKLRIVWKKMQMSLAGRGYLCISNVWEIYIYARKVWKHAR